MSSQKHIEHAAIWSAIDVSIRFGLKFVVLIILARLLAPEDFGLVAMLLIFISIGTVLIESGFSQGLIQRANTTHIDESSIFFFTIVMGGAVATALFLSSFQISEFFEQPVLESMVCWFAFNIFINSFGVIHITLLTKELDFKTLTKVNITATLVSSLIAVVMAFQGWGVWSLVVQVISSTVLTVIMLWLLHSWRPLWVFSVASIKSYFKFGGFLLFTALLYSLYVNLYAVLIGKQYSAEAVGFFAQAKRLQQLPVDLMSNIVGRVAFPVFSKIHNDKDKLARGMRKALVLVMFINAPLMLGILMLAEPLIRILFGEKWLVSAPILEVLALVGLLWPMHELNVKVLVAQGHSAINAKIQLIKVTVGILLLFLAVPYGILAVAYSQLIASVFGYFVNAYYTKKFIGYGGWKQIRDVLPYVIASFFMMFGVFIVSWSLDVSYQLEFILSIIVGATTYLVACKFLKLEALEYVMQLKIKGITK